MKTHYWQVKRPFTTPCKIRNGVATGSWPKMISLKSDQIFHIKPHKKIHIINIKQGPKEGGRSKHIEKDGVGGEITHQSPCKLSNATGWPWGAYTFTNSIENIG